ncbi:hypothetical protein M8756_03740 [Lutimaribacter sp. EGI FJ00015]|uniref:Uncharacterized protein n=1 Tax=Lutimaribacter degradans TaxID=2945989 RepID=A0ACC5ZSW9_9RHOB|nr:hypothetical protein [Lutimaribacter sp. EGI FJ00013]MCM2560649.1 hypothetical protein [Lutimaribacter sp. EGI FJ00013]MCO0612408.1 hypothetical protein [Lutimaribacter sp. EGI FJ00015]MCO0634473.1 hypothetical protein [Lutimaribacter sp. EGI FJ00014]
MKPNFALILSFNGIRLLHRAPAGWLVAGDVALDVPDLGAALERLRKTAHALEPEGLRTKLVIPNEQIRFLTIDTGDVDDEELPARVAAALDGATPYAVSELSYDWVRDGTQTHVAAVAQETLDEAEAFALEHAFRPVSFVAIPESGTFSGEPFFGVAPSSASWLSATDSLSRDMQPIHVIGTVESQGPDKAMAEVEAPASREMDATRDTSADGAQTPAATASGDTEQPEVPAPDDRAGKAADDTQPPPSTDAPEAETPADEPPTQADELLESDAPRVNTGSTGDGEAAPSADASPDVSGAPDDADDAPDALAAPSDTPPAPPAFASIRAARDVPPAPPKVGTTAPVIDIDDQGEPARAPAVTGNPSGAVPEDRAPSPPRARQGKSVGAGFGSFLSRRDRGPRQAPKPPAPSPAKLDPAPTTPLAEGESISPVLAQPAIGPDPEAERQRMTIFGARKPAKPARSTQKVGGKPRYLGLVLTAILLLFLAGVAAWASIFSEDSRLSRLFGAPVAEMETALGPEDLEPEGDTAPLDPAMVEGDEAAGEDVAALGPDILSDDLSSDLPQALPDPAVPDDLTPEEAAVRYAATGIWLMAPKQPETPGFSQLDDVYTASIDPDVNMGDAVALPPLSALQSDQAPEEQASPVARGTAFDMDDRGLVRATPEGALTPDGVVVIAGRPPILPPSLPQRVDTAPALAAAEQARLAAFRPRARPDDLVQQNERSNLGGLTRAELGEIRPRLRPEVEKAEEETDETATAQAVAQSLKPRPRPGNFERVVRRTEQDQPEPVQTAAAVAPRTVAPPVPSTADVSRAATVRNAMRMNRVNLIGVYGKPSSRRALIRLSNGRYQKVQVGDRLDGGRVQAIGESELRYTKGGRSVTLTMPRG